MKVENNLVVMSGGVRVRVCCDDDGRPLSAHPIDRLGDPDRERLVTQVAMRVFEKALSAWRERQHQGKAQEAQRQIEAAEAAAHDAETLAAVQQAAAQKAEDELAARSTKRKIDSDNAWKKSAEKRAKASAEHRANKWFADAHAAHPKARRVTLAKKAWLLAENAGIGPDERAEITEGRAQEYLDRLPKPPATPSNT